VLYRPEAFEPLVPLKNLYVGAAGVSWGLDALRRRGMHAFVRTPAVRRTS